MEFSIAINVGMEIHSSQWGTTEYSRCFAYSSQFEVQLRCMISPMHSRTHLLILLLSHASTHLLTHSPILLLTYPLAYLRISSSILLCIHSINQSHSYAPTHFLLHALCILYTSYFTNNTTNNTTTNTYITTGWDYDRVMRNNFTPEDLCAIADIVSMIKRLGTPYDTLEPYTSVSLYLCISSKLYTTPYYCTSPCTFYCTRLLVHANTTSNPHFPHPGTALQRMNAQYAPYIRIHIHHRIQQLVRGYLVPILHRVDKRKKTNLLTPLLTLRAMAMDHSVVSGNHVSGPGQGPGQASSSSASANFDENAYKVYSRKHGVVTVDHPLQTTISTSPHTHTQIYTLREQLLAICDEKSLYRQKGGLLSMSMSSSSKPDIEKDDLACFESFYAVS